MNDFHPLVREIIALLTQHHVWFEEFQHQEVLTSADAAQVRNGYSLSQGTKALIVRVRKKDGSESFCMIVVPGDKRFSSKKVKDLLQATDIRFATEDEIALVTKGVKIGGIPPFGNLFGIPVYADSSILHNEKIIFNAGDRQVSISMFAKDYMALVNPQVAGLID